MAAKEEASSEAGVPADSVKVSVSTRKSKDASFHVAAYFDGSGPSGGERDAAGLSIGGRSEPAVPSATQQIGALLRAAGGRIHAELHDRELGSALEPSDDDVIQALADVVYVRLVVRDMARFKDINN